MSVAKIDRGDKVQACFHDGSVTVTGDVVYAPHIDGSDPNLGWVLDVDGQLFWLGNFIFIKKIA